MNKDLLKKILLGTAGTAGGAYFGHEITPQILGFDDSPPAKRMSAILDAAYFGTLAASPKFRALGADKLVPGWLATELLPVAAERINRPDPPTATEQASKILSSPTARGAGMGAAGAGLAALLTGLAREKKNPEQSRAGMIGTDFAKYILPALAAGGTIGSLTGPQQ